MTPHDPRIPSLQRALDPARARPALAALLGRDLRLEAVTVVRHKPGRRCLIAYTLDGGGVVLGKVRARGLDARSYRAQRALWEAGFHDASQDGVSVAEPLGLVPALAMWCQRVVPGRPLEAELPGPGGEALCGRVACAVHKLHGSALRPERAHTVEDELRTLEGRLADLASERPALRPRLRRLLNACRRLAADLPLATPRPLHRDFYQDQLLVDGDRLTLLDFDLCAWGDPALDVGNFAGHLTELALRTRGDEVALAEQEAALVEGYLAKVGANPKRVERAIDVYKTLTLARHIALSRRFPARTHTTEALLALCETRLAR